VYCKFDYFCGVITLQTFTRKPYVAAVHAFDHHNDAETVLGMYITHPSTEVYYHLDVPEGEQQVIGTTVAHQHMTCVSLNTISSHWQTKLVTTQQHTIHDVPAKQPKHLEATLGRLPSG